MFQDAVDSRGIPGWDKVDKLATYLLTLQGLALKTDQVGAIIDLYNCLHTFDQKRMCLYQPRYKEKQVQGHFKCKRASSVTLGVEATQRLVQNECAHARGREDIFLNSQCSEPRERRHFPEQLRRLTTVSLPGDRHGRGRGFNYHVKGSR